MWKNDKKVDEITPELSTNKEFSIHDVNGIEIGKTILTKEGKFVEDYFFVTVKKIDGELYVPTEETEISGNVYIQSADKETEKILYTKEEEVLSLENVENPDYIENIDLNHEPTSSDENSDKECPVLDLNELSQKELLQHIADNLDQENPFMPVILKNLEEAIEKITY